MLQEIAAREPKKPVQERLLPVSDFLEVVFLYPSYPGQVRGHQLNRRSKPGLGRG